MKLPVKQTSFVVLDTETTGLDANNDTILSVGAIKVIELKMLAGMHHDVLLKHAEQYNNESISVHGILPAESAAGIEESDYLPHFLEFVADSVIVAHHAAFDYSIISAALKKKFGFGLINPVIDTRNLAIRLEQGSRAGDSAHVTSDKYTLDALCDRYNIEALDRHTASGDAYITAVLFMMLVKKLKLENAPLKHLV